MTRAAPAAALLLALSGSASPALALELGVSPLGGTAPDGVKRAADAEILRAIGAVPGNKIIDLHSFSAMFGAERAQALAACLDDPCRRRVLAVVHSDELVLGEIDPTGDHFLIKLRRVASSTTAAITPKVRVSREIEGGKKLATGVEAAVAELFPDERAATVATLLLKGGAPEGLLAVDGKLVGDFLGEEPIALTLSPGPHALEARAPGHFPQKRNIELRAGEKSELDLTLEKNHSNAPLIVAGAGVVAVGIGLLVGLTVNSTANDWIEGCPGIEGPCMPGFTRARYEEDADAIARGRVTANGLVILGAVAVVGGVIWYFLDPGTDVEVEEATP